MNPAAAAGNQPQETAADPSAEEQPANTTNAIDFNIHIYSMIMTSPSNTAVRASCRWRFLLTPDDHNKTWKEWFRVKLLDIPDVRNQDVSTDLKLRLLDWTEFYTRCDAPWRRLSNEAIDAGAKAWPPIKDATQAALKFTDIWQNQKGHSQYVQDQNISYSLRKWSEWSVKNRRFVIVVSYVKPRIGLELPQQTFLEDETDATHARIPRGLAPVEAAITLDPAPGTNNRASRRKAGRQKAGQPHLPNFRPADHVAFIGADEGKSFNKVAYQELEEHPILRICDTHGESVNTDLQLSNSSGIESSFATSTYSHLCPRPQALQEIIDLQHAVCGITCSGKNGEEYATGFMISPFLMMTCLHPLYSNTKKKANTQLIPYCSFTCNFSPRLSNEPSVKNSAISFSADDVVYPADFKTRSQLGFDVAIIRLKTKSEKYIRLFTEDLNQFTFFEPSFLTSSHQQQGHLIHYPKPPSDLYSDGIRERVINFYQTTNIVGFANWEIFHRSATTPGSSGGPIVSIDGRLLGMHRRSGEGFMSRSAHSQLFRAKPFFGAALRVDLFLRDSTFNIARLESSDMNSRVPKMVSENRSIPDLRNELVTVYQYSEQTIKLARFRPMANPIEIMVQATPALSPVDVTVIDEAKTSSSDTSASVKKETQPAQIDTVIDFFKVKKKHQKKRKLEVSIHL